jgi:uncharacterized protein (TIGR00725 family)
MGISIDPQHTEAATKPLYIAVIGDGRPHAAECVLAEDVGRLIAEHKAILVCGGLSGVMEAAARGCRTAGGTSIGILPGHDRSLANPHLDHVITTGLGHARNVVVASSGDAVIAVGGGYGTLSEIGLAAKIGRPVIILQGWRLQREADTAGIWYASTPSEAVALAIETARGGRATRSAAGLL